MEVDQIQCKFAKIRNGGYAASEVGNERERMDDEEEEGEGRRSNSNKGGVGGAADPGGGVANGLYGWPSSRIVRVSKATGGKDRHSKVITSRGLRDRRVRLSVNTAIQFYDLQDRLGYDQPSKAVEWLLTVAAGSIAELPPMNSPFPVVNKPPSEEKMSAERGANQLMVGGGNVAAKSSVRSSSSETSKGSGLSISRSESRVRARERAKERAVEREKDNEGFASFTELLSGGIKCINGSGGGGGGASMCRDHSRLNNENPEQSDFFPNFPMDYFSNGISSSPATTTPLQIAPPLMFAAPASHHHELQPFSFTPDHLVSVVNTASSSATRGTLQSNISSSPPSLHFPTNFFPAANHRHLVPGFDARLQLYDGDANGKNEGRNSEPKRKDKP